MQDKIEGQENIKLAKKEGKPTKQGPRRIVGLMKIALYLMGIAIMAILVFSLFQSRIEGQSPSVLGHQMYIVQSGSMLPALDIGSLIIIRETKPQDLRVGDIITYSGNKSDNSVTHRIVDILEGETLDFITRGDANDVNDPLPVKSEAVVGKVVFHIPYLGLLMHFIRTKEGFFSLIILPAGIIIFSQLFRLNKSMHKDPVDTKK